MSFDWQDYSTKLEIYKNLFNNKFLADVKFIFPQPKQNVSPQIIYGHAFLLSIHSSVFHKLFYGSNGRSFIKSDDFYELIITNGNYAVFGEFIKFFYNLEAKKFSIEPHNRNRTNDLYYLLKLAQDYNVTILENLILSYFDKKLKDNINFNTIVNTLLISNLRSHRYKKTFNMSVTFIKRNFYKFLQLNLVQKLDREGLEILLRFDEIDYWTNEIDLYQAAIGWIEKQKEFDQNIGNYREVLGDRLIKLIRFPTMTYSQFKKVVIGLDVPKILNDDEIRKLFSYISNATYERDNEMIDLCGFNHVPRKKIKQWKDYKLCQTFAPYNAECQCYKWCTSISLMSALQGALCIFQC